MGESNFPSWSIGYLDSEKILFELIPPVADKRTEGYDWISACVTFRVGKFNGQIPLMLTLHDIIHFKEQLESLYDDLKGGAELTTIEQQVELKVKTDGLGHMFTEGYLKDDVSFGNKLSFKINFDQTILKHPITEINAAVDQLKNTG
jgi:hypothetical protein